MKKISRKKLSIKSLFFRVCVFCPKTKMPVRFTQAQTLSSSLWRKITHDLFRGPFLPPPSFFTSRVKKKKLRWVFFLLAPFPQLCFLLLFCSQRAPLISIPLLLALHARIKAAPAAVCPQRFFFYFQPLEPWPNCLSL